MLGDIVTRCLLLLFGYAYPAFECFKSIENNRVEKEELRFWCQYWVIIAILTICERIGDTFVSWLPMYGEIKLALFICLWYPKTKGTGYIYETLLRPFVTRHETDIERKLLELRARAWDFALYYWQNCTDLGQSAFFQVLEYLTAQPGKFSGKRAKHLNYYKKNHQPVLSVHPDPNGTKNPIKGSGNTRNHMETNEPNTRSDGVAHRKLQPEAAEEVLAR
ncbi:hypothetical protein GH714_037760 [Hevea brasiliensis]|uniref:HVA22-like protein n=1 Tax=Hevea brasiliensis TaxID=3981 RepID=A0A6A6KL42_HEVBR|nr:hypothetical protein GH714_037760 [Hevea brasiliensis]